jgi:hypothetical protein
MRELFPVMALGYADSDIERLHVVGPSEFRFILRRNSYGRIQRLTGNRIFKLLHSDLAEMHGLQLETRVIREIGL